MCVLLRVGVSSIEERRWRAGGGVGGREEFFRGVWPARSVLAAGGGEARAVVGGEMGTSSTRTSSVPSPVSKVTLLRLRSEVRDSWVVEGMEGRSVVSRSSGSA